MAPTHSRPYHDDSDKKMPAKKRLPLMECAMNKIAQGTAVFTDEHVEAMAPGTDVKLPKNLDDIVDDVDDSGSEEGINWDKILQPIPKEEIAKDDDARTHSEAIEKAVCPKCDTKRTCFAFFDDATWTSDGEEVQHYNIWCQGTESSPCSCCSESEKKTHTPVKKIRAQKLVQAKGFNLNDFEGEEADSPPKKRSKCACRWCDREPCIVDDNETVEEGRVIVDNLNAQKLAGVELNLKNYRHSLYKMHARALGYVGYREILPNCVHNYLNEHFSTKDEERTGYIAK